MASEEFCVRYGPWALIAGGSDGIGEEFARQLARLRLNLLLVGRRPDPLKRLAGELIENYEVDVRFFTYDLSRREELESLLDDISGIDVGLLVCNAAVSHIAPFLEQPFSLHERLLELNMRMPLRLGYELGRRMKPAGRGGIILLSSMAAFQGTALTAHYAASKAYLRVLAEGMWAELRPYGVDVVASCPGTVNTPTFLRDDPVNRPGASLPVLDVEPVVTQTLRALGKGPVVVPGLRNRLAAFLMERLLPRRSLIRLTERTTRAMYPQVDGETRGRRRRR